MILTWYVYIICSRVSYIIRIHFLNWVSLHDILLCPIESHWRELPTTFVFCFETLIVTAVYNFGQLWNFELIICSNMLTSESKILRCSILQTPSDIRNYNNSYEKHRDTKAIPTIIRRRILYWFGPVSYLLVILHQTGKVYFAFRNFN